MTEIELELTCGHYAITCITKNNLNSGCSLGDDMWRIRVRMGGKLGSLDYIRMCEVMFQELIFSESRKHDHRVFTFDSVPLMYTGMEYILKEDTTIRVTCKQPDKVEMRLVTDKNVEIDLFEVFKALAYLVNKNGEIYAPRSVKRSNVSFFQKGSVRVTIERKGDASNITFQTIPEDRPPIEKVARRKKRFGMLDSGKFKTLRGF